MKFKATVREQNSNLGLSFGRVISRQLSPFIGKGIEAKVLNKNIKFNAIVRKHKTDLGIFGRITSRSLYFLVTREVEIEVIERYVERDCLDDSLDLEEPIENYYVRNIDKFQSIDDEQIIELASDSYYKDKLWQ